MPGGLLLFASSSWQLSAAKHVKLAGLFLRDPTQVIFRKRLCQGVPEPASRGGSSGAALSRKSISSCSKFVFQGMFLTRRGM